MKREVSDGCAREKWLLIYRTHLNGWTLKTMKPPTKSGTLYLYILASTGVFKHSKVGGLGGLNGLVTHFDAGTQVKQKCFLPNPFSLLKYRP